MLQFDVPLCEIGSNLTHKVQRYIHLCVASELVSDVGRLIPDRVCVTRTNTSRFAAGESPLSFPYQVRGYPAEGLYEQKKGVCVKCL
jgi:hypothetical protein